MATAGPPSCLEQIGLTAGEIWHTLAAHGPMSLSQLVKRLGKPRDLSMQALGWLAREGKIVIEEDRRSRIVSLR